MIPWWIKFTPIPWILSYLFTVALITHPGETIAVSMVILAPILAFKLGDK